MIALTSIAPTHRNGDRQKDCVQSWIDAGYKVYSLNCKEECEDLKPLYPNVNFVKTHRHHRVLLGRPYVLVSALIDFAKDLNSDHFLLINSDIEIIDKSGMTARLKEWSNEGVIYMHREDFESTQDKAERYVMGMDGFFIHRKWLDVFPQSQMCLGQCFWDYWLPFKAQEANVKIIRPVESYLYHKVHPVQYNRKNWEDFAHTAKLECRLFAYNTPGAVSNVMYQRIMKKTVNQ